MRSFVLLCLVCIFNYFYNGVQSDEDHFLLSDKTNDQFIIVGSDFTQELKLDFNFGNNFIKAIKAKFKDGNLTFFWIYFNNGGEVHRGIVSIENSHLETSVIQISNSSKITDIDVLDDTIFASTNKGEVYSKDLNSHEQDQLLKDATNILALKVDHRNIYFSQCSGRSVLIKKSISNTREYETPLCFQLLEIDHEDNKMYAAASNKIYTWSLRNADKFTEIYNSGNNGEVQSMTGAEEFVYFKTRGNKCFKMDKKTQEVTEIPQLTAIPHHGPIAYFIAPVFNQPPTTTVQATSTTKSIITTTSETTQMITTILPTTITTTATTPTTATTAITPTTATTATTPTTKASSTIVGHVTTVDEREITIDHSATGDVHVTTEQHESATGDVHVTTEQHENLDGLTGTTDPQIGVTFHDDSITVFGKENTTINTTTPVHGINWYIIYIVIPIIVVIIIIIVIMVIVYVCKKKNYEQFQSR